MHPQTRPKKNPHNHETVTPPSYSNPDGSAHGKDSTIEQAPRTKEDTIVEDYVEDLLDYSFDYTDDDGAEDYSDL